MENSSDGVTLDLVMLRSLSDAYAVAVDKRDAKALVDVFLPDGVLRVEGRSGVSDRRGAEIAVVTSNLTKYTKTLHLVTTASYEVDGDRATGDVYCVAHHLMQSSPDYAIGDLEMLVHYRDEYRRSVERAWKIVLRIVSVQWTTVTAVGALGEPLRAP